MKIYKNSEGLKVFTPSTVLRMVRVRKIAKLPLIKKSVVLLMLLFLSINTTYSQQIKLDKVAHFSTFMAASSVYTSAKCVDGNYTFLDHVVSTQMTALFFGGLKEFGDATFLNGTPSWNDILYNQLGALTGTVITYGVNKWRTSKKEKSLKL